MERAEEEILQDVAKVIEKHATEVEESIFQGVDLVVRKGIPPCDAFGITREEKEGLYAHAYQLFNNGKSDEALQVFMGLSVLDGQDPRHVFGQAACYHLKKEYIKAEVGYVNTSMMDPENPVPLFHAVDCAEKRNDLVSGSIYLQMCIDRCVEKPEFTELKSRAEVILGGILHKISSSPSLSQGE